MQSIRRGAGEEEARNQRCGRAVLWSLKSRGRGQCSAVYLCTSLLHGK